MFPLIASNPERAMHIYHLLKIAKIEVENNIIK